MNITHENATLSLEFDMPQKREGYLRLVGYDTGNKEFAIRVSCGDVERSFKAASSSFRTDHYYSGREDYLFNLCYSEKTRSSLTITFPEIGKFQLKDIQLYALPMNSYQNYVEALRNEPLENIKIAPNCISGTVDLSKDKYLCMSIPYSRGWSAIVDGEKTKILEGNYMFMVLPLAAGHHNIEFFYFPPGLKLGMVISGCCLMIIIGRITLGKRKIK